ncbi:ribonuclease P protein subunit p20-like [Gigantopelta aegis]|uniref:ribonuclease P protein subunit p20-like n=1 Tax=Gigantopelta aegis TaxID=1735272 RepID=UPI001B88BD83|nr:ribonuclease P protein subunit p20-like [Gigantopelta aegis]
MEMQNEDGKRKTNKKDSDEGKDMLDREEYTLRKRLPPRLPKRKNDVYISRRVHFQAQLKRCQKLLDSGNEVYIHGLGAAINRAINVALQLKENGRGTVEVSAYTSTVDLADDLEPDNDDDEPEVSHRNNSAVHIKVYRPDLPSTAKSKDGQ